MHEAGWGAVASVDYCWLIGLSAVGQCTCLACLVFTLEMWVLGLVMSSVDLKAW